MKELTLFESEENGYEARDDPVSGKLFPAEGTSTELGPDTEPGPEITGLAERGPGPNCCCCCCKCWTFKLNRLLCSEGVSCG